MTSKLASSQQRTMRATTRLSVVGHSCSSRSRVHGGATTTGIQRTTTMTAPPLLLQLLLLAPLLLALTTMPIFSSGVRCCCCEAFDVGTTTGGIFSAPRQRHRHGGPDGNNDPRKERPGAVAAVSPGLHALPPWSFPFGKDDVRKDNNSGRNNNVDAATSTTVVARRFVSALTGWVSSWGALPGGTTTGTARRRSGDNRSRPAGTTGTTALFGTRSDDSIGSDDYEDDCGTDDGTVEGTDDDVARSVTDDPAVTASSPAVPLSTSPFDALRVISELQARDSKKEVGSNSNGNDSVPIPVDPMGASTRQPIPVDPMGDTRMATTKTTKKNSSGGGGGRGNNNNNGGIIDTVAVASSTTSSSASYSSSSVSSSIPSPSGPVSSSWSTTAAPASAGEDLAPSTLLSPGGSSRTQPRFTSLDGGMNMDLMVVRGVVPKAATITTTTAATAAPPAGTTSTTAEGATRTTTAPPHRAVVVVPHFASRDGGMNMDLVVPARTRRDAASASAATTPTMPAAVAVVTDITPPPLPQKQQQQQQQQQRQERQMSPPPPREEQMPPSFTDTRRVVVPHFASQDGGMNMDLVMPATAVRKETAALAGTPSVTASPVVAVTADITPPPPPPELQQQQQQEQQQEQQMSPPPPPEQMPPAFAATRRAVPHFASRDGGMNMELGRASSSVRASAGTTNPQRKQMGFQPLQRQQQQKAAAPSAEAVGGGGNLFSLFRPLVADVFETESSSIKRRTARAAAAAAATSALQATLRQSRAVAVRAASMMQEVRQERADAAERAAQAERAAAVSQQRVEPKMPPGPDSAADGGGGLFSMFRPVVASVFDDGPAPAARRPKTPPFAVAVPAAPTLVASPVPVEATSKEQIEEAIEPMSPPPSYGADPGSIPDVPELASSSRVASTSAVGASEAAKSTAPPVSEMQEPLQEQTQVGGPPFAVPQGAEPQGVPPLPQQPRQSSGTSTSRFSSFRTMVADSAYETVGTVGRLLRREPSPQVPPASTSGTVPLQKRAPPTRTTPPASSKRDKESLFSMFRPVVSQRAQMTQDQMVQTASSSPTSATMEVATVSTPSAVAYRDAVPRESTPSTPTSDQVSLQTATSQQQATSMASLFSSFRPVRPSAFVFESDGRMMSTGSLKPPKPLTKRDDAREAVEAAMATATIETLPPVAQEAVEFSMATATIETIPPVAQEAVEVSMATATIETIPPVAPDAVEATAATTAIETTPEEVTLSLSSAMADEETENPLSLISGNIELTDAEKVVASEDLVIQPSATDDAGASVEVQRDADTGSTPLTITERISTSESSDFVIQSTFTSSLPIPLLSPPPRPSRRSIPLDMGTHGIGMTIVGGAPAQVKRYKRYEPPLKERNIVAVPITTSAAALGTASAPGAIESPVSGAASRSPPTSTIPLPISSKGIGMTITGPSKLKPKPPPGASLAATPSEFIEQPRSEATVTANSVSSPDTAVQPKPAPPPPRPRSTEAISREFRNQGIGMTVLSGGSVHTVSFGDKQSSSSSSSSSQVQKYIDGESSTPSLSSARESIPLQISSNGIGMTISGGSTKSNLREVAPPAAQSVGDEKPNMPNESSQASRRSIPLEDSSQGIGTTIAGGSKLEQSLKPPPPRQQPPLREQSSRFALVDNTFSSSDSRMMIPSRGIFRSSPSTESRDMPASTASSTEPAVPRSRQQSIFLPTSSKGIGTTIAGTTAVALDPTDPSPAVSSEPTPSIQPPLRTSFSLADNTFSGTTPTAFARSPQQQRRTGRTSIPLQISTDGIGMTVAAPRPQQQREPAPPIPSPHQQQQQEPQQQRTERPRAARYFLSDNTFS